MSYTDAEREALLARDPEAVFRGRVFRDVWWPPKGLGAIGALIVAELLFKRIVAERSLNEVARGYFAQHFADASFEFFGGPARPEGPVRPC